MIPYAILSGQLVSKTLDEKSSRIRILELSPEGFTFRMDREISTDRIEKVQAVVLHFYSFAENTYRKVKLQTFQVAVIQQQPFWSLYRVTTKDSRFRTCAQDLTREYTRYIRLKLEEEDAVLSKELVGYPEEMEQWSLAEDPFQQEKAYVQTTANKAWQAIEPDAYRLAIGLDNRQLYEAYLQRPIEAFRKWYWQEKGLAGHPLEQHAISYFYIGNQFCPLLFPEENVLAALLQKMEREQITPVFVFSYMEEHAIPGIRSLLEKLLDWQLQRQETQKSCLGKCDKIELLVNDWGMLALIQEICAQKALHSVTCSLGVLLNKRRKDTRLPYKNGTEAYTERLQENACNEPGYAAWLRGHFGIERIEYESCDYPVKVQKALDGSLHIPYYQMNTASRCTLYAACHDADRGHQTAVSSCPAYCETWAFGYPEGLHIRGRYNSLFGYDEKALLAGERIQEMLAQNVDRIVVTL